VADDRAITARLQSIEADITTLALDAIVNAANEPLIMGGGVDGAIRRKAGPEMESDLRRIGRCPTGEAIITRGYRMPARFVIHTVAPVWSGNGSEPKQDRLLTTCYRNALRLADDNAVKTIAFPCIGTGIYGWPADRAARLAFAAVTAHLRDSEDMHVTFCCFSGSDRARYADMIVRLAQR
jgi:O-acetyl-ADP-ribose deacetylase (regulator of RNase III)